MQLFRAWSLVLLCAAWMCDAGCGPSSDRPVAGDSGGRPAVAPPPSLSQTHEAIVRGEVLLVDVRELDEVTRGMAAPAVWMPTSRIQDGDPAWEAFVASLPRDRKVALYCAVGSRSGSAAKRLRARGIEASNLGGFSEWAAAGLPVRTPTAGELQIGK